jgi:hypothetical protein
MADAKLGLEVAARNNAICRRKGFKEETLAQSNKELDEAFTRYQNLVTQNCLKEMAPRLEKPEHYVLRQVAHATKLAERRAEWFYKQGNTDDPVIPPLDYPKSEKLLGELRRLALARRKHLTSKQARKLKDTAMKQYEKSLIPILIKRMVDAASAEEHGSSPAPAPAAISTAEAEATAPAPAMTSMSEAEATPSPAPTPAATPMTEAEAAEYAAELTAREAELDAKTAEAAGDPPSEEKETRRRWYESLAKAKAFHAWNGHATPTGSDHAVSKTRRTRNTPSARAWTNLARSSNSSS